MRKRSLIIMLIGGLLSQLTIAQSLMEPLPDTTNLEEVSPSPAKERKLNFFIVSKREKGSLDLATRFNIMRSKVKSFFRKEKFVAIVAKNSREASSKIQYRLKKNNAVIGTLWFDSHGKYIKGYSLFYVGNDEFNPHSIHDKVVTKPIQELAPFIDSNSNIIIGSCYGGATYHRTSIDYTDTTRMNGDSLMIGLGEILGNGKVYGSEGWVMTKPGLFQKKAAVEGYPKRKLFLDKCYKPVWEHVSKWNSYVVTSDEFRPVNALTMDKFGNLKIRERSTKPGKEKKIQENLKRLKPGLYK
ncbi:MAG TPA: hypothetical protein PLU37_08400 [Chitinophagaceae bacterium]|nr:hypothetical protein [Chitinophagaceae bacterium]